MRTNQSTRSRSQAAPAKLSTLFRASIRLDDAPTADYWERHFEGDSAATNWLFEWYAPLCNIVVMRILRRFRDDPTITYDDLISDASLGLLNALRLAQFRFTFSIYAMREIKKTVYRQIQMRRWVGRRGAERASVIRAERGKLTAELGYVPNDEEMSLRLRGLITNPNIAIHGEKQMYTRSQIGPADRRPMEPGKIDPPDRCAIESDMWRLAKKTMSAADVKILKLLLEGHSARDIGRRFNLRLSTANDRCNGVLWLCKSNAKLAEYLGTEPAELPRRINGRLPRLDLVAFRAAVSEPLDFDAGRIVGNGRKSKASRQTARVA